MSPAGNVPQIMLWQARFDMSDVPAIREYHRILTIVHTTVSSIQASIYSYKPWLVDDVVPLRTHEELCTGCVEARFSCFVLINPASSDINAMFIVKDWIFGHTHGYIHGLLHSRIR